MRSRGKAGKAAEEMIGTLAGKRAQPLRAAQAAQRGVPAKKEGHLSAAPSLGG
jgi:hypothetical protein